jgi:hypothetical protein
MFGRDSGKGYASRRAGFVTDLVFFFVVGFYTA